MFKKLFWITVLICVLASSILARSQTLSEYRLYTAPSENFNYLVTLRILPNGEIQDLAEYNPIGSNPHDIDIAPQHKVMLVTSGAQITRFHINDDGTLITLGTTSSGGFATDITPNEELVISDITDIIFELSPSGDLLDTFNRTTDFFGIPIGPQGDIGVTWNGTFGYWVYEIDYMNKQLQRIQSLDSVGQPVMSRARFTPDGNILFSPGFFDPNYHLMVFKIDSTQTLSTTQRFFTETSIPQEVAITPNGQFAYFCLDTSIASLSINTSSGQVTDTGKRFPYVNGGNQIGNGKIRIVPDGNLAVVSYQDTTDNRQWIATAYLYANGDLVWTGYRFPYDAYYASGLSTLAVMELYPIYAPTSIPPELWQGFE